MRIKGRSRGPTAQGAGGEWEFRHTSTKGEMTQADREELANGMKRMAADARKMGVDIAADVDKLAEEIRTSGEPCGPKGKG